MEAKTKPGTRKPARPGKAEELDRLLEEVERKVRPSGKGAAETDLPTDPLSTSYWCYLCCGG